MRDLGSWRSRSCGWGGDSRGPKGREVGGAVPGSQASASPTHLSSWRMAHPQSAWRGWSAPSSSAAHIRPPPEPRTPGPKVQQPSPPCRFPRLAPRARGREKGDRRGSEARSLRPSGARQVGPRRSPAPGLTPQARVVAPAPCPPQTRDPAPSPILLGLGLGQPQGSPGPAYLASNSGILRGRGLLAPRRNAGPRCSGPSTSPPSPAPGLTVCPGYLDGRSPATPRPLGRTRTAGPRGEEDPAPSASSCRWG